MVVVIGEVDIHCAAERRPDVAEKVRICSIKPTPEETEARVPRIPKACRRYISTYKRLR